MDRPIQYTGRLIGTFLPQSIDENITNICIGSTNFVWANYQSEDRYMNENQNKTSEFVPVGQGVKQMTTYCKVQSQYNIETKSTKLSND